MRPLKIKRMFAIALHILTIAPWFITFFISNKGDELFNNSSITKNDVVAYVDRMEQWGMIAGIWILILIIVYIVYLYKTHDIPRNKRSFWACALFVGNIVVMPYFWYQHIWRIAKNS